MTDESFRELCNTYGFAPSRALREMLDKAMEQERERIIAKNAPEIEKINAYIKALEEAVAAEREACAKVCEAESELRKDAAHKTHGNGSPAYGRQMSGVNAASNCAAAIRARGQQ